VRGNAGRGVVAAAFALLFVAVMAAEYAIFRRGVEMLLDLGRPGVALLLYFLESLLVLILVVSLIGFVASGLWTFYRAPDTRLFLAAPMPVGGLYLLRTVETFTLTGWPLAVVGGPALLALGTAHARGTAFYATGAAVLGLFALLIAGAGALLTAAAGIVFRRTRTRLAVVAVTLALVAGFAGLVGRNVVPSATDFHVVFTPELLNGKPAAITFIETRFGAWLSHPFAAALHDAATGSHAGSPTTRTLLWLGPLLALGAAATLGRRLYAAALPAAAERFVLGGVETVARRGRGVFPRWLPGPVGALVERDLLVLARNPHEWSRATFLGVLLALYTAFVAVAPLGDVGGRPAAVARLVMLNVLAAGYFLTAFGLRFVFPSTSLEGRAAWVLFSSPLPLRRLLAARLGLSVALLAIAVVPIALVGTLRLTEDPRLIATVTGLLLCVTATTATLLLAFGTVWPDFRETSADALSTSGGGLAATVLCLVYVGAVGWLAREATLRAAAGRDVAGPLAVAVLVSGLLAGGALAVAARRIRTLEVT
jgi:hypothetical protein